MGDSGRKEKKREDPHAAREHGVSEVGRDPRRTRQLFCARVRVCMSASLSVSLRVYMHVCVCFSVCLCVPVLRVVYISTLRKFALRKEPFKTRYAHNIPSVKLRICIRSTSRLGLV